jgi:hypothetical protein
MHGFGYNEVEHNFSSKEIENKITDEKFVNHMATTQSTGNGTSEVTRVLVYWIDSGGKVHFEDLRLHGKENSEFLILFPGFIHFKVNKETGSLIGDIGTHDTG